jgi:ADP-ribosylglycohydrolase
VIHPTTKADRFRGSIIAGAIGDAFGSAFEGAVREYDEKNSQLFADPPRKGQHSEYIGAEI